MLFSAPMVRSLLAGTKTQTRRILKPQPTALDDTWGPAPHVGRSNGKAAVQCNGLATVITCPYGQPGDQLWVRETWLECGLSLCGITPPTAYYRADHQGADYFDPTTNPPTRRKWQPSIHMPRWASRITLEVTAVSVERLQDISEWDAAAEGVLYSTEHMGHWSGTGARWQMTAREAYRDLWESINGAGSWDANPWVWVIEFKVVKP